MNIRKMLGALCFFAAGISALGTFAVACRVQQDWGEVILVGLLCIMYIINGFLLLKEKK